jgi:hypothetical protein
MKHKSMIRKRALHGSKGSKTSKEKAKSRQYPLGSFLA